MNALMFDTAWGADPSANTEIQPPEADAAEAEAAAPEVEEEPAAPPHKPVLRRADVPMAHRTGFVPDKWRKHLIEYPETDYAPPFWVSEDGHVTTAKTTIPMCPPLKAGDKALVMDDWGHPRVITVTEMQGGEITGQTGVHHIMCKAWVALKADTPIPKGQKPNESGLMSEIEAAAVEKELNDWARFLGVRAEKYGWCSTFESILQQVGVTPWRPGYKTVTLQFTTTVDAKDLISDKTKEAIGGDGEVKTATITLHHTLKDVSRVTFNNGDFRPLLRKAGYKNPGNIYVHAKEVETE